MGDGLNHSKLPVRAMAKEDCARRLGRARVMLLRERESQETTEVGDADYYAAADGAPRAKSDCHFKKTATEYDRKPGIKWLSCTAK